MLMELYVRLQNRLQEIMDNENGATAVEYGIMVGLIAVAIIVTVSTLGTELNRLFGDVVEKLQAVVSPA